MDQLLCMTTGRSCICFVSFYFLLSSPFPGTGNYHPGTTSQLGWVLSQPEPSSSYYSGAQNGTWLRWGEGGWQCVYVYMSVWGCGLGVSKEVPWCERADSRLSKGRGGRNHEDSWLLYSHGLTVKPWQYWLWCSRRNAGLAGDNAAEWCLRRECEYCACQLGYLSRDVSEEHSTEMRGARRGPPLFGQSTLSQKVLPGVRSSSYTCSSRTLCAQFCEHRITFSFILGFTFCYLIGSFVRRLHILFALNRQFALWLLCNFMADCADLSLNRVKYAPTIVLGIVFHPDTWIAMATPCYRLLLCSLCVLHIHDSVWYFSHWISIWHVSLVVSMSCDVLVELCWLILVNSYVYGLLMNLDEFPLPVNGLLFPAFGLCMCMTCVQRLCTILSILSISISA